MTVVGFVAAFVANSMKLVGSGLIGNFTYPCFGGRRVNTDGCVICLKMPFENTFGLQK
jgi:hypothetical protein